MKARKIEWRELSETHWAGCCGDGCDVTATINYYPQYGAYNPCVYLFGSKLAERPISSDDTKNIPTLDEAKVFCQTQLDSFIQSIAEIEEQKQ